LRVIIAKHDPDAPTRQFIYGSGNASDMTDSPGITSIDQATMEELSEMITELAQYRERLLGDTLSMAQRAKVMKAQAMAHLQPSLAQIDAQIEVLRQRQSVLSTEN